MFPHFDSSLFTTICFTHHCTDMAAAQLSSACIGGNQYDKNKMQLLSSLSGRERADINIFIPQVTILRIGKVQALETN